MTRSIKQNWLLHGLCLMLLTASTAKAQGDSNLSNIWYQGSQQMNNLRLENQQMIGSLQRDGFRQRAFADYQIRQQKGLGIIKANKATVTFVKSPTVSIKKYLLEKADDPEDKRAFAQNSEVYLKQFLAEMQARNLAANNLADGSSLAFIMLYELYFGQKPTAAHLQNLRNETAKRLLNDAYFQGGDGESRQTAFEGYGILAIYVQTLQKAGNPKAKLKAQQGLEMMWGGSIDTIFMTATGFMHKGDKIIADGKATNFFNSNPNVNSVPTFIKQTKALKSPDIYQQYLNAFYQEFAKRGGKKNDLASLATYIILANYYVISGKEPNPSQVESLYNFVRQAILKSRDIQSASDENKQLAAEFLAIGAIEAINLRNTKLAQSYLKQIFKALDEDLNNYQLTANGIERVK